MAAKDREQSYKKTIEQKPTQATATTAAQAKQQPVAWQPLDVLTATNRSGK